MQTEGQPPQQLSFLAVPGIPLVEPGDDLAGLLGDALQSGPGLLAGDTVVIAQKLVSKAENRYVFLDEVVPGEEAVRLAGEVDKDPRLVQLILNESSSSCDRLRAF